MLLTMIVCGLVGVLLIILSAPGLKTQGVVAAACVYVLGAVMAVVAFVMVVVLTGFR